MAIFNSKLLVYQRVLILPSAKVLDSWIPFHGASARSGVAGLSALWQLAAFGRLLQQLPQPGDNQP